MTAHEAALCIIHRVRTFGDPSGFSRGQIEWLVSDSALLQALEIALDGEALNRLIEEIEAKHGQ